MESLGILAVLEAKPGKEAEVEEFLKSALRVLAKPPAIEHPEILAAK